MRRWKPESREAIGIITLVGVIILVRLLFAPAPILLSPPDPPAYSGAYNNQNRTEREQPHRDYPLPSPASTSSARSSSSRAPNASARNAELFEFDPNTLDSSGFLRLGFTPAQTHSLLKYRASGARFDQPQDFSRAYVVSEQMYLRLAPYISIESATSSQVSHLQPTLIEVNSADTAKLKRLRGIGSYFAQKIVQYRDRLGGFVSVEQMMEVEGIDQERFALLAPQIEIDFSLVRKIDLKTADQPTLGKHPYIGPYAARWIVHYRQQLGDSVCALPALLRRNIIKPQQTKWLEYYIE